MSIALIISCTSAVFAAVMTFLVGLGGKRILAHWFFVAGMFLLALEASCTGLAADSVLPDETVHWARWAMLIQALVPFPWAAFSLTYARGNPQEQLARSRLPLLVSFLLPVGTVILFYGDLIQAVAQNAQSGSWSLRLGVPGSVLNATFLVLIIWVVTNLERTFRASVGTMRWRIKFMILALGLLFCVRAYTSSQVLLFRGTDLTFTMVNNGALLVACIVMLRSVFRAGNFEVGVYPSQSVITNSFTVIVAGVYLVVVGLFAKVVSMLGGQTGFALKAFIVLVALVLLATLLLSDRVRLYVRQFVSRHFQRPVYDYRTVLEKITQGTARCVEPVELSTAITKLASEIFQCLSVTVWLADERKEVLTFAASTSLFEENAAQLALSPSEAKEVINALSSRNDPVDIDAAKDPWANALRRIHPDLFHKGGNRVCVPMIASGEFLGTINLGDRVAGVRFSMQDMDLLRSVAGQAAAGLLKIRLSQKLAQARQLEAFQAMSAFFVHDLKNTASTLSLMLQNFPVHYQDPGFREDALRGMSKTVVHINDLISRLNMLRHELKVQAVECDLNELVTETLKGQGQAPGIELVKDLHPLPRVQVDPAQIEKVLTNLLLNSREALGAGGQVHIQTSRRDGWAVLAVSDNGCGMTQEFMQTSLFRPFKTTKKNGIGIGMFHCKMIVEAHHGRIEVESEPGKGTAFRVLLPISQ